MTTSPPGNFLAHWLSLLTRPGMGFRVLPVIAVVALVIIGMKASRHDGPSRTPDTPLTAAELDAYLTVALEVRGGRREARLADWKVEQWPEHPRVASALSSVDWTMNDYVRVEGHVSNARLAITDPEAFQREFAKGDAPDDHLELVRPRIEEVLVAQGPLPEPVR